MTNDTRQIKATILNVIPDERIGGPQQRVLQVAKHLKDSGIETIVVTPKGDQTFAALLRDAGIQFHQLRSFRRLPNPSNPFAVILWLCYCFPCIFSLWRMIRKYQVDIVHVNGILNIQVAIAAKLSGRKLVWHLNDVRNPKLARPVLLPLLYSLPDAVVAASVAAAKCYFGNANRTKELPILYPPIDTARFYPDGFIAEEYRKEFKIKPGDRVVGIVGNISPVKGYEYFFSAANLVKQASPQVKFLVVGKVLETQKEYWQRLQNQITDLHLDDDVIMAGHRTDIHEILNAMDVFVSSSILDAAPIVILEAMACAKPVVGTRVGGIPELVADGETGTIVPPRDPAAMADAIVHLLNNPEKLHSMGVTGQERVAEHFDLSICAQKHEAVYNAVLSS